MLFLRAKESRNASNRRREFYVMNDIYHDCMLTSICAYLSNYQPSLKTLQNDEFEIIGYARKSPTTDNLDTRVRLLESMINNLRSRSFAHSERNCEKDTGPEKIGLV
ncbi:uncharacterized protein BX664DRAFT_349497 [Halteromyces radiatus]|uniref:uncharacterized protein n=1 Tax=Halteromyces radiatus TaxID=101107 RepID=UPI00221FD7FC|nr:uncharacterized protein BX664DRAFT_349497 [Halteromyces radiatus]KAI8089087.1 hypothetical protein BX664DRAFT_349497 [Halteromyces radiatus]